jgi:hypothetical protein
MPYSSQLVVVLFEKKEKKPGHYVFIVFNNWLYKKINKKKESIS